MLRAVSQPDTVPVKDLLDALRKRFPQYSFEDVPYEAPKPVLDNSKARCHQQPLSWPAWRAPCACQMMSASCLQALKTLGLGQLIDPRESIVDMAVTLIERGIAKPKAA